MKEATRQVEKIHPETLALKVFPLIYVSGNGLGFSR
jgi:hypothetical protein